MARRITNSRSPSGHPLRGATTTGGRSFSGPLLGGSRAGGSKITKGASRGTGLSGRSSQGSKLLKRS